MLQKHSSDVQMDHMRPREAGLQGSYVLTKLKVMLSLFAPWRRMGEWPIDPLILYLGAG
jgi:hypothetical protein